MLFVNKRIPMSVVDGPGNRFAIFLQGCNFNCKYCHNPETIRHCVHCGACVAGCPGGALSFSAGKVRYDEKQCIDCDHCIAVCPHGTSPKIRPMTAEDLMEEIKDAMPFIEGISVSGGESTLQAKELIPLFRRVKTEGLSALIDSNGSLDFSKGDLNTLVSLSDGVMLDVKAWEPEDHLRITGRDNGMVKKNLVYLAETGKLEEIRLVLLDCLDNEHTLRETARLLGDKMDGLRVKLISYRHYGVRKAYADTLRAPDRKEKDRLIAIARDLGFGEVVDI